MSDKKYFHYKRFQIRIDMLVNKLINNKNYFRKMCVFALGVQFMLPPLYFMVCIAVQAVRVHLTGGVYRKEHTHKFIKYMFKLKFKFSSNFTNIIHFKYAKCVGFIEPPLPS